MIIGGGLAGLAAAYDLTRSGADVTVLEAAPTLGGLASSVQLGGRAVERFYHFVCANDHHLEQLVADLGLQSKLSWHPTSTAFYYDGQHYNFGSPLDLLRFRPVPPLQRLRFGLHVTRSRYRQRWRELDRIPAREWLIECVGPEAYDVIWHPLLKVKFGDEYRNISAAWIWHRIWRVAASRRHLWSRELMGCLENGSATLVDALTQWLQAQPNAKVVTNARVEPMQVKGNRVEQVVASGRVYPADTVVSTVALPVLDQLVPGRTDPYFENIRGVGYIGVVCALMSLKRPFSHHFWTNINDPRISFNGIIEQTNLNRDLREAGLNVLYVPFYIPTSDPRYTASDEELAEEYIRMLTLMRPDFGPDWIDDFQVYRATHAQAVYVTGFADQIPDHQSSVDNLFVTDSTQFYPEDRTLSAAIQQGRAVARMIARKAARP